jgi:hypothetical protein
MAAKNGKSLYPVTRHGGPPLQLRRPHDTFGAQKNRHKKRTYKSHAVCGLICGVGISRAHSAGHGRRQSASAATATA